MTTVGALHDVAGTWGRMRPHFHRLVLAPAIYGFSVGTVRSLRYAALNVVKFPLLIAVTLLVCAGGYTVLARLLAPRLRSADVRALVVQCYGDVSVMLASFAPVCLFLALTLDPPRSVSELGEYPLFLGANVLLIAGCASFSLIRQGLSLSRRHGLARGRTAALVASWLALSLVVGGQCAWYLRPFFGNRAYPDDGSFCHGARPDFRGAGSIYEAVGHLFAPPGSAPKR
jgi:hypothetical protein